MLLDLSQKNFLSFFSRDEPFLFLEKVKFYQKPRQKPPKDFSQLKSTHIKRQLLIKTYRRRRVNVLQACKRRAALHQNFKEGDLKPKRFELCMLSFSPNFASFLLYDLSFLASYRGKIPNAFS